MSGKVDNNEEINDKEIKIDQFNELFGLPEEKPFNIIKNEIESNEIILKKSDIKNIKASLDKQIKSLMDKKIEFILFIRENELTTLHDKAIQKATKKKKEKKEKLENEDSGNEKIVAVNVRKNVCDFVHTFMESQGVKNEENEYSTKEILSALNGYVKNEVNTNPNKINGKELNIELKNNTNFVIYDEGDLFDFLTNISKNVKKDLNTIDEHIDNIKKQYIPEGKKKITDAVIPEDCSDFNLIKNYTMYKENKMKFIEVPPIMSYTDFMVVAPFSFKDRDILSKAKKNPPKKKDSKKDLI